MQSHSAESKFARRKLKRYRESVSRQRRELAVSTNGPLHLYADSGATPIATPVALRARAVSTLLRMTGFVCPQLDRTPARFTQ